MKVYRKDDDKPFALKLIKDFTKEDVEKRNALRHEVEILSSCKSDYIIKLYDCFENEQKKVAALFLELVPDGSLSSMVKHTMGNVSEDFCRYVCYTTL